MNFHRMNTYVSPAPRLRSRKLKPPKKLPLAPLSQLHGNITSILA